MRQLWQLMSLLGSVSVVSGVAAVAVKLARYLDQHLRPATRKRYVDYLRNGGLVDHSKTLIEVAGEAVDNVFGVRHFSLECLLRSIAFTLGSIAFFLTMSGLVSLYVSFFGNPTVNNLLATYWSFPLRVSTWGLTTWLSWSIIVDFFSLLKTRWLIRVLRQSRTAYVPVLCALDFVLGFAIYIIGVSLLSLLPMVVHSPIVQAPVFSFENGAIMSMLVVVYAKIFMPNALEVVAAQGATTSQAMLILHTDIPQTVIAILFLIQLIPLATFGADFFYASMMPSIWLWFFLVAVFIGRIMLLVGGYLGFVFARFRTDSRTLEVGATVLLPVLLLLYLICMLPYAAVALFFMRDFEVLLGILGQHITDQTLAP